MDDDASQRSDVDGAAVGQLDEAGGLPDDVYCPECDYNLRGLTSERCPECGCVLDFMRLAGSQIPWVHRNRIGWYRAYWQTVWLVMFRTKRFCNEIARPVSFRHSQSFRWLSVLHAFIPLAVVITLAWFGSSAGEVLFASDLGNAAALAVLFGSLFLFLAAVTGLPSYLFHPRHLSVEHQNRAIAMSYYTCGALAWTPLAIILGAVATIIYGAIVSFPLLPLERVGLFVLGIILLGGPLIAWWFDLVHISRRALRCETSAVVRVGILVPVLWVLMGGLILPGIPLVFLYVALFFVSLN